MLNRNELLRQEAAIAEMLHLSPAVQAAVRTEVATVYLARLGASGRVADPDDAQLLGTLPEFSDWWRLRWAELDGRLLARAAGPAAQWLVSGALAHNPGFDVRGWYRGHFEGLTWGYLYPNDVVMDALRAEKRRQNRATATLKNLLTQP